MTHDSKTLLIALWLAFFACVAMLIPNYIRAVEAEDDCAFGTYAVERTPLGLVCILEPTGAQ